MVPGQEAAVKEKGKETGSSRPALGHRGGSGLLVYAGGLWTAPRVPGVREAGLLTEHFG